MPRVSLPAALREHVVERRPVNLEREMQVEVVLVLELERLVRRLEGRHARPPPISQTVCRTFA